MYDCAAAKQNPLSESSATYKYKFNWNNAVKSFSSMKQFILIGITGCVLLCFSFLFVCTLMTRKISLFLCIQTILEEKACLAFPTLVHSVNTYLQMKVKKKRNSNYVFFAIDLFVGEKKVLAEGSRSSLAGRKYLQLLQIRTFYASC